MQEKDKQQQEANWATILGTTKEEREENAKAMREWAEKNPEMAQA